MKGSTDTPKEWNDNIDYFELVKIVRGIPGGYSAAKSLIRLKRILQRLAAFGGMITNIGSSNPPIVAICHPDFRGVKSATYALVPDVIEIPEVYDRTIIRRCVRELRKYSPEKILISGHPEGYDALIKGIKQGLPDVRIFFLSHASFTWYDRNVSETSRLSKIVDLHRSGIIEKMGFVKRDVATFFKSCGHNAYYVMNRFSGEVRKTKTVNRQNPQIGVFGSNMWHRNILNQTLAGLMIPNATVHVNQLGKYFFLDERRIVRHGFLAKPDFDRLIEKMDVNLYISFTDCFPLSVIESLSAGIPCITSDTSEIYEYNSHLREMLVTSKIDSPAAIAERIKRILMDFEAIQKEIILYLPQLRDRSEELISYFLE